MSRYLFPLAMTSAVACALIALSSPATAAPSVWAIDDGEKLKENETASKLATGADNPIWSPGQPIRVFALKNETIAVQIIVTTDDAALSGVTVDLDVLTNSDVSGGTAEKIQNALGATDPLSYVGRPIERFREHFFDIKRVSGGKKAGESLQWAAGSGPPADTWLGRVPDALIPIEVAPSWLSYPMAITPHTNGIIWIDITIPKTQAKGLYKGDIVVKAGDTKLSTLPIELTLMDVVLPDRPLKTMLYYEVENVGKRIGNGPKAESHLWQLFHHHRIEPLHGATSVADVERQLSALDGSLYTTQHGYQGPGEGMGDGVLALGTFGTFGEPTAAKLEAVEHIADLLAEKSILPTTDTFVYAIDEQCGSPRGLAWKRLMAGSQDANAKKIRVAWTCSEDALKQPVDIVMQTKFDPAEAARAPAVGKELWIYNGHQPQTAAWTTDAPAINPRVNGWIQALFGIGRWFYWESMFWYDGNHGGKGPYDPFVTSETFHNEDDDRGIGEGVLVYPGKQLDKFTEHSVGMDGIIASIRLKNWRRGIEDAGYLQLAHAINPTKAEAVAKSLLPVVVSAAKDGNPPSWSDSGKTWFDARKVLAAIITRTDANITVPPPIIPPQANQATGGCRGCKSCSSSTSSPRHVGSDLIVFFASVLLLRQRLQKR